ncbi:hypothetical protein SAMN02910265_03089 [Ruminococcus flavefaciens]|uniref:AAA-like domain-containing protein n=1 Tax=Ruminococcus flavefaciens TaxID=1265 RepID=A0A1H6LCY2_RUMFL|nr:hypothetical protein [Ruminococcus flavefaciens]SEH86275.1 hypothetical protein SAMN02910265_03089 [Ruminococcus flavefaciens]
MGYELPDKIQNRIKENFYNYLDACDTIRDIEVEIEAQKKQNVTEEIAGMMPAIKEDAHTDAVKQVRAEYRLADGRRIYGLSTLNSESIIINGLETSPNSFIPDRALNDPVGEDTRLYFDDQNDKWFVREKNGLPKLISRFVIVGCLIVNASGPGKCLAFVVFLKGRADPLIFWDGVIEASELCRQTQFHQRGLSYARKDLYHESFLRALRLCKAVCFLTLPKHAGWNWTPEGSRIFVDSAMMRPEFEGLFLKKDTREKKCNKMYNVFCDITLESTDRKFDDVVADYHSLLPDTLPNIIGTVISAASRLLPQYKEEGLLQDRLLVMETSDDDTAKAIIAVTQNKNHRSTEALFSSMRMPYIEEEITHYVDCVAIMRHSCTICSMHDRNKVIKYLYELLQNGYADDDLRRLLPVLLIDNAGTIPEEFQIHQLSIADRLKVDSIEQVQRVMGELDYFVVKLAEQNPDAVKQRIKAAVTTAKEIVSTLPRRSQSSSAVMLLSTAIMMNEVGVLTDAAVQRVQDWLRTEAKSRTSMGRSVCKAVGTALSNLICNDSNTIGKQYGPPFYTIDGVLVASDDSINVTKDKMNDELLADVSVGRNTALQYLQDEDVLFKDEKSKGEQKTWTVKTEDGISKTRRFYSLSRDLLSPEANRIVDEAVASDLFHKPNKHIDHFFPFIKHPRLDMYAGQVITDYKHGTPFIAVTGAQGSGKSTWLMMQVLQRAEADDLVVVMDPTNSFCREELIAHGIPIEKIDKSFSFWDMSTQGWPVDILNFEDCKDITQRVQRLSSLLISGMHLTGPNQKAIVMAKVEEWLKEYEINNNLSIFNLPKRFDENADERKLKTRLDALLSTVKESGNGVQPPGWDKFLSDRGKVFVISSGDATINVEGNPFDVLFDTLYSYKDKHKDGSMTLILDEVQTFNHHKTSTLVNILSRVRKDNISVILASQDFLNASLTMVYKYCGTHILFRPLGEECTKAVAELTKLDINVIRTLPDFNCAVMGSVYSEYFKRNIQLITAIMGESYRPPYVG